MKKDDLNHLINILIYHYQILSLSLSLSLSLYIYIIKSLSLEKIKLESKLNFNWSPIVCHVSHLIFNICAKLIMSIKIEESKSN